MIHNWHLSSIKASLENPTYNLGLTKPEEKTLLRKYKELFFSRNGNKALAQMGSWLVSSINLGLYSVKWRMQSNLSSGKLLGKVNATIIILVPKGSESFLPG